MNEQEHAAHFIYCSVTVSKIISSKLRCWRCQPRHGTAGCCICLQTCGDVTAAGKHTGSPQHTHTRPGLLCSPPSLRCAMRHCGGSELLLAACWSEGHGHGGTIAFEPTANASTMAVTGVLRVVGPRGPGWTRALASFTRDCCLPSSGKSRPRYRTVNTRRSVFDHARACVCARLVARSTEGSLPSPGSGSGSGRPVCSVRVSPPLAPVFGGFFCLFFLWTRRSRTLERS